MDHPIGDSLLQIQVDSICRDERQGMCQKGGAEGGCGLH